VLSRLVREVTNVFIWLGGESWSMNTTENSIGDSLKSLKKELDKYDGPNSTWSREYFEGHKQYYREIVRLVGDIVNNDQNILEIGSLPCHLTSILTNMGYSVVGTDIDPYRLAELTKDLSLEIVQCDFEQQAIPFKNNSFDYVLLTEVFEHLRINPIKTLDEINRVLTEHGTLIFSTPNQYSLKRIWRFITGKGVLPDGYTEFEKLDDIGHMGHVRVYTPQEICLFLQKTGFKIKIHRFSNFGNTIGEGRNCTNPLDEL